ncbi:hypothetical protein C8R47DRAFT_1066096 [Mycena vitilis]|nr:hypothetical protein C8R47DRAFT_1066096 [Mycena vitilis]
MPGSGELYGPHASTSRVEFLDYLMETDGSIEKPPSNCAGLHVTVSHGMGPQERNGRDHPIRNHIARTYGETPADRAAERASLQRRREDKMPHQESYGAQAEYAREKNDSATLEYTKNTFTAHYTGNRQPIGLYTHPIHLSTTYPGVNLSNSTINTINEFLDWAQVQKNGALFLLAHLQALIKSAVWIVSNEQLLAWVKNPVPVSQLGNVDALKRSALGFDYEPSRGIRTGTQQDESTTDSPFPRHAPTNVAAAILAKRACRAAAPTPAWYSHFCGTVADSSSSAHHFSRLLAQTRLPLTRFSSRMSFDSSLVPVLGGRRLAWLSTVKRYDVEAMKRYDVEHPTSEASLYAYLRARVGLGQRQGAQIKARHRSRTRHDGGGGTTPLSATDWGLRDPPVECSIELALVMSQNRLADLMVRYASRLCPLRNSVRLNRRAALARHDLSERRSFATNWAFTRARLLWVLGQSRQRVALALVLRRMFSVHLERDPCYLDVAALSPEVGFQVRTGDDKNEGYALFPPPFRPNGRLSALQTFSPTSAPLMPLESVTSLPSAEPSLDIEGLLEADDLYIPLTPDYDAARCPQTVKHSPQVQIMAYDMKSECGPGSGYVAFADFAEIGVLLLCRFNPGVVKTDSSFYYGQTSFAFFSSRELLPEEGILLTELCHTALQRLVNGHAELYHYIPVIRPLYALGTLSWNRARGWRAASQSSAEDQGFGDEGRFPALVRTRAAVATVWLPLSGLYNFFVKIRTIMRAVFLALNAREFSRARLAFEEAPESILRSEDIVEDDRPCCGNMKPEYFIPSYQMEKHRDHD